MARFSKHKEHVVKSVADALKRVVGPGEDLEGAEIREEDSSTLIISSPGAFGQRLEFSVTIREKN